MLREVFISVDVETNGPMPHPYSMCSVGACVADEPDVQFYRVLQPISEEFLPSTVEKGGMTPEVMRSLGTDPGTVMADFAQWVQDVSADGRPVFVAFNATFDWQFVNWYFHTFLGRNPFGISGCEMKTAYMFLMDVPWAHTVKRRLDKRFRSVLPHTHNALGDALEQAELFRKMRAWQAAHPRTGG